MNDQTPNFITESEFNDKVKGWAISTRGRMAANAPVYGGKESSTRTEKKLAQSISFGVKYGFGSASRIQFQFERHGIFVHYGVGRGYIKTGNSVVRGYITKLKRKKAVKHISPQGGGMNRHPVDWFDVEIRTGLKGLADITQEFYGDLAMRNILDKLDKFLIHRK